jgi:hypothetical protein
MFRRRLLASLSSLALAAFVAAPAMAGAMDGNGVNCGILRGSPFMCIKNQAAAPVVAVQVVNLGSPFAPNSWIDMGYFGGPIPQGGTTVVKFSTYGSGCQKLLFVKLASGATHPFQTDVCAAASITVPNTGW